MAVVPSIDSLSPFELPVTLGVSGKGRLLAFPSPSPISAWPPEIPQKLQTLAAGDYFGETPAFAQMPAVLSPLGFCLFL